MNKSLAIIIAVGLALGCDDPAVSAKALDVLEHGIVAAHVSCSTSFNWPGIGSGLDANVDIKRLVDGSTLTRVQREWDPASATNLCERNEACAATGEIVSPLGSPSLTVWAESGEVHIEPSGQSVIDLDIDTQCTGFNLDTFD